MTASSVAAAAMMVERRPTAAVDASSSLMSVHPSASLRIPFRKGASVTLRLRNRHPTNPLAYCVEFKPWGSRHHFASTNSMSHIAAGATKEVEIRVAADNAPVNASPTIEILHVKVESPSERRSFYDCVQAAYAKLQTPSHSADVCSLSVRITEDAEGEGQV